jgi:beta-xylosidase
LLVWTSDDLVTWQPLGYALTTYDGDVWAPDLAYHDGEFLIYYRSSASRLGTRMVAARDPAGPWSAPVDVGIGWVDPGHVVDDDGRRWIHVSDGFVSRLSDDGRTAIGEPLRTIEPWPIPPGLPHEGVWLEGPKLFKHQEWWHYLAAQGGTAGPATSHMVIHARGPTPIGPWTWSPANPVIRTRSRDETWWSVGHGTACTGPDGTWWVIAHGYRKGFHTLGRQTLVIPVRWNADGWLEEDARPLPHPCGAAVDAQVHDHFAGPALGVAWRSWRGMAKVRLDGGLWLASGGTTLRDTAPLTIIPGHVAYEIETELELPASGCLAGLCLYYNAEAHYAIAVDQQRVMLVERPPAKPWPSPLPSGVSHLGLRIRNDHHEVTSWYALDGGPWTQLHATAELSGLHHNIFRGFLSLRAGIFSAGGETRFRSFRYQAFTS